MGGGQACTRGAGPKASPRHSGRRLARWGALLAFAGLVVILQGVALALALVLPAWAAFLIVGVAIVVIGALFARSGLAMLSLKALSPDRTIASLQKDTRLVKEHI